MFIVVYQIDVIFIFEEARIWAKRKSQSIIYQAVLCRNPPYNTLIVAIPSSSSAVRGTIRTVHNGVGWSKVFTGVRRAINLMDCKWRRTDYTDTLLVTVRRHSWERPAAEDTRLEVEARIKDVRALRVNIDRAVIFRYDLYEHFM